MKKSKLLPAFIPAVLFVLLSHGKNSPALAQASRPTWNPKAAQIYLDDRSLSWIQGMGRIDHGTSCVSCHTSLPFALARSSLRTSPESGQLSSAEVQLLASVSKRVEQSQTMQTFFTGPEESKGTESVLNALVLACYRGPSPKLTADEKTAFETLWARQVKEGPSAGSWNWFSLGNEPWEAPDSQYWGATLAALAVQKMPGSYQKKPDIQANLQLLKKYLADNEPSQSLHNKLSLLIASGNWTGLLSAEQRKTILDQTLGIQQSDGGWRTADIIPANWSRNDGTPQHPGSDGYATGLITYALEVSAGPGVRPSISKGRAWLLSHQSSATGGWDAYSVNKRRDPNTEVGKFMSDAATAYAVLAITQK